VSLRSLRALVLVARLQQVVRVHVPVLVPVAALDGVLEPELRLKKTLQTHCRT